MKTVLNTSDHIPIVVRVNTDLKRHKPAGRISYNWSKCDMEQYGQVVRNILASKMKNILVNHKHDIDIYLRAMQEALSYAMIQCVPVSKKCKYKRPYWDNELKVADELQKQKRRDWVIQGTLRGMHYDSYKSYKATKRQFAANLLSYYR